MNLIEHVWDRVGWALQIKVPPRTLEEIEVAITEECN